MPSMRIKEIVPKWMNVLSLNVYMNVTQGKKGFISSLSFCAHLFIYCRVMIMNSEKKSFCQDEFILGVQWRRLEVDDV